MIRPTLRHLNNCLSAVVVALCLYVILAPFWPKLALQVQKDPPLVVQEKSPSANPVIPKQNTLVIPKLKLQQEIFEGGEWMLNKGVWHTPDTGSPLSGNMVLSGHRFTYGGPAVFYHLDKLKEGDPIIVYWQGNKYQYSVTSSFVVKPTEREVLAPSDKPVLTIYTCTPLWSAKDRLIIRAEMTGVTR